MTLQHRESRKRGKEESERTLSPSEQPSRGTRASARLAAANANGDGNTHTRPTADEHPQRARLPRDSNLPTRACPNASTTIMNTPSHFHPTLYLPKKNLRTHAPQYLILPRSDPSASSFIENVRIRTTSQNPMLAPSAPLKRSLR